MTTNIRKCRISADISQKEVAFKLGVSVQSVSYWENGERMPSRDNLQKLAKLYNTTIDNLLGNDIKNSSDHFTNIQINGEIKDKLDSLTTEQLIELRGYISGKFGK